APSGPTDGELGLGIRPLKGTSSFCSRVSGTTPMIDDMPVTSNKSLLANVERVKIRLSSVRGLVSRVEVSTLITWFFALRSASASAVTNATAFPSGDQEGYVAPSATFVS